MAKRFGRNQRRKLIEEMARRERQIAGLQFELSCSRKSENETNAKFIQAIRDQLSKGTIPLEVEHFLDAENRSLVMHAIFDERQANLHYQHAISAHDLKIQRDREERERFGLYLGRAIADKLAEAYARGGHR